MWPCKLLAHVSFNYLIMMSPVSFNNPRAARKMSIHVLQCIQKASKAELAASNLPDISIIAHAASTKVDGRPYALVALAMGAASGGPELDGVLLHWACVSGQDQDWQQPPPGWHTDPNYSQGAGTDLLQISTSELQTCTHDTC